MSLILIIFILACILIGCGASGANDANGARLGDIDSYRYLSKNHRFVVVSYEHIDVGSINGLNISTLVDRETRVMYILAEKYQSGYGLSMEVLVDANGRPILYEGELN